MEEVGVVVEEEGAAKVRHYDLRSVFSRLRPEGFERPHVLKWLNCNYFMYSTEDATFTCGLKIVFTCVLTVALITIILYGHIVRHQFGPVALQTSFPIGPMGIVPLFASILVAALFVTNPRKERVQTASAPVRQV